MVLMINRRVLILYAVLSTANRAMKYITSLQEVVLIYFKRGRNNPVY